MKDFEKSIRRETETLSRKQLIEFSWRCGVRALPFLGVGGNFDFWKTDQLQTHLYSIFYALDFVADVYHSGSSYTSVYAYASAADASDISGNSAIACYYAAYAATSATYAATAVDGAVGAATAAAVAAVHASQAAASGKWQEMEAAIWSDLKLVRGKDRPPISVDWYGEVWNNFLKALEAEGCAYWGRLFQRILNDGLILDPKTLERRINVPPEIRRRGASEVGKYLEDMEREGAEQLNEARIIILGDKGAGKTSLARKLVDPDALMPREDESTAGVDTQLWKLKNENVNVRIWDFAGHTVTHAVHQFFLSERCLYIMVYDGRSEERNRMEYWLDHMKNYGGDSKAFIVVNERDHHRVDIPFNNLREKYAVVGDLHSFSIENDKRKLEDFRKDVANHIANTPSWNKQEIPTSNYKVKEELEKLFIQEDKENGREHITRGELEEIAASCGVDDVDELLSRLHDLGVGLWYRDMEEYDTLILNPEWISHGVYTIINWVNEKKAHSLTLKEFSKVFDKDAKRYPKTEHEFLFKLMIRYKLAYEAKDGKELIIPHLLKEDRPAALPEFSVGESLMLRYKADMPLPPHTVSRFIVAHNKEIKKENKVYLVWRYGVVLEKDGCLAMVREDRQARTISVSVKGGAQTEYIGKLRGTLNDIFASYKSDKPELQYKVERYGLLPEELHEKNPLWLPDRKIMNHVQQNRPYYDDDTGRDIPLDSVVQIYNIKAENLMMGGAGSQFVHDQSIRNTFNFENCNIGLQGNLNELAGLLDEAGKQDAARELEGVAKALELVEKCQTPEEIKKKGVMGKLKRLVGELEDENSGLHKTVRAVKNGVSIAKDIIKACNSIAHWAGGISPV